MKAASRQSLRHLTKNSWAARYPQQPRELDRWILARRLARNKLDPRKPYAFFLEQECSENGEVLPVAAIFLTNRECPWRCLMCDLWKNTLSETVPVGAIPAQIDYALRQLAGATGNIFARESRNLSSGNSGVSFPPTRPTAPLSPIGGEGRVRGRGLPARFMAKENRRQSVGESEAISIFESRPRRFPLPKGEGQGEGERHIRIQANESTRICTNSAIRQIKLYNAGSFFDPRAIPPADFPAITRRLTSFERVIVESHPALVGEATLRFRDLLAGHAACRPRRSCAFPKLEVALGLETVHPTILPKLNKRMTLQQFSHAAAFLRRHDIALRVFVLVNPPFLKESEALPWAKKSVDFAFACGAGAVSLIPVRGGNGALETLAHRRVFSPPRLATLEAALAYGIGLRRGRVFADTWDLEKFAFCPVCFGARKKRLEAMNANQLPLEPIQCGRCGGTG